VWLFLGLWIIPISTYACSTFKLQKGDKLIYAHNLNQGDLGVPGMVFVNKRGVFKLGRTWSELSTAGRENPSSFCWISRYGSVTYNAFGRDLPDGGMNEAGLFIWEMNEDPEYPVNTGKPKLDQMSWMQYVLDNFSTTEEALQSATDIEISGWGWHFFIGDASGDCAALTFVDGKPVIHRGVSMPVPALFNTPYDREMEVASYYQGFGGQYEVEMNNPHVPRFVKTGTLIDSYCPSENIVDYGLGMLDSIAVFDKPEWSILFDVREKEVYYKTRQTPEIKKLSMHSVDFSNQQPVQVLNMDVNPEISVEQALHPYSNQEMETFLETLVVPILGEDFITSGGLSLEEYLDRNSTHWEEAANPEKQFFSGTWEEKEAGLTLILEARGARIQGTISNSKDTYSVDQIHMAGNKLTFTFLTKGGRFMQVDALIEQDHMDIRVRTTEEEAGTFTLKKEGAA